MAEAITKTDEEAYPDAIITEIIHLPNAFTGNVSFRPVLHTHETPYLTHSQIDKNHQIPLSDISVTVEYDKVLLFSEKFKKRIIPRLTSAHNYVYNALPIYHFLSDLQMQGLKGRISLETDGIFNIFDEIPRIKYGNCILSKHKWRIKSSSLKDWISLHGKTEELLEHAKLWRIQKKIPQFITISEGDNKLLLDLSSVTCIDILLSYSKKYSFLNIEEFLFSDFESFVKDVDGNSYSNEFLFFFKK